MNRLKTAGFRTFDVVVGLGVRGVLLALDGAVKVMDDINEFRKLRRDYIAHMSNDEIDKMPSGFRP